MQRGQESKSSTIQFLVYHVILTLDAASLWPAVKNDQQKTDELSLSERGVNGTYTGRRAVTPPGREQ